MGLAMEGLAVCCGYVERSLFPYEEMGTLWKGSNYVKFVFTSFRKRDQL